MHNRQLHWKTETVLVDSGHVDALAGLSLAAMRQCRWVRAVEVNGQGRAPFEVAARLLSSRSGSDLDPQNSSTGSSGMGGGTSSSRPADSTSSGSRSQQGSHDGADGGDCRFEYIVSTAAAAAAAGAFEGADVIIVDPPRKGLEPELLAALATEDATAAAGCAAHTLVYLSCGFASFQRDVEALVSGGAWRLEALHGFEFFPGTDSIESLAVFCRVQQ